jgi:deoxyribodipyrimidine photo-lyase
MTDLALDGRVRYNACATGPDDYARNDTLPGWALATLADHESDPRPRLYGREALYKRTLWGKNTLESGYFWTLGRDDRAWPERPIYGKVRSMSSASATRKLRLSRYLQEHQP